MLTVKPQLSASQHFKPHPLALNKIQCNWCDLPFAKTTFRDNVSKSKHFVGREGFQACKGVSTELMMKMKTELECYESWKEERTLSRKRTARVVSDLELPNPGKREKTFHRWVKNPNNNNKNESPSFHGEEGKVFFWEATPTGRSTSLCLLGWVVSLPCA